MAPYRAILRYYRCDTPYRAILSRPSQQSPNRVRYPPLVPCFTHNISVRYPILQHIARYLCDTPGKSDSQSEVGEVFGEIGGELPAKFGRRFSSFFCWENRQKHFPPKLHRKFHHQTSLRGSGLWRSLDTPGKQTRKSFAILSLKVSRDMKSIAAGPLWVGPWVLVKLHDCCK